MQDIGGQAVIEGVMMKSHSHMSIAVRLQSNKIKIFTKKLRTFRKFWRLPFVRGIFQLIYILILGIKALLWSSDQQLGKDEKITGKEVAFTMFVSFGFAILFFIVAPFFITKIFVEKGFWFNLIDGILRLVIFLVYIALIGMMKDIKTLFQYHGAEHKCIHCLESKKQLTIANIKQFSTLHPRCGTAFILIVLVISIIIFSLVTGSWQLRLVSRIVLIPVVAGISYELLKLSARFKHNFVMKAIVYPGLMMQKLTTKEPDEKQIEVALVSLKEVLKLEK
jgi:uncharacterized protein YqhQ